LRNPGLKDAVVIKKSLTAVRTVSFKGLFVTLHFLTVLSVVFFICYGGAWDLPCCAQMLPLLSIQQKRQILKLLSETCLRLPVEEGG